MGKLLPYLISVLLLFWLPSCLPHTQPSYYLSPFDLHSNGYQAIPLKSDTFRSATYADFGFAEGGSNYRFRDNVLFFSGSVHRSHSFGHWNAYYGANLALGTYSVGNYYRVTYKGIYNRYNDTVIHIANSNQSFGGYGLRGGLNYVIPFGRNGKGEWRIGIQSNLEREFGNYLAFRKSIPDSAADILATDNWTRQLGISSELIRRSRRGIAFGYKVAYGRSFTSPSHFVGDSSSIKPFYFSNTFILSKSRMTGFCQFNFGRKSASFQTGVNYQLGK